MSLYTTKVTRRSILAGGAALVALAATPRLTMAAGSTPLPDLPYEVDIVNTGSNATLVLQALLDQLGYFKEFNVRANTLNVGDGTKLMGSLISNQSDICLLSGFSQVLPAIERGAKLKLVAGANRLIAQALYTSNPDIKTVEDLRGKTIGTGAIGALLHQMMIALLRKHGIDASEVQFVNIGSSGAVFKAVVAGKVDAGPAMVDVYDQQAEYGVHAIADFWTELSEYPYQGSYAAQKAIDEKADGLARVLAAYGKMYRFMMEDPSAEEAFMAAYKTAIGAADESQGRMMIKFTRQTQSYAADLMISEAEIDYMQDLNLELDVQKERLTFAQVVDLSLAKKAVALIEAV